MSGDVQPTADDRALASRLVGLAEHLMRQDRLQRAGRLLARARSLGAGGARLSMAEGRLAILRGETDEAVEALREVRDLDPFDEDAADLLGRLHAGRSEWRQALDCLLDATLLEGGLDAERAAEYAQRRHEALAAIGDPDLDEDALQASRAARLEELSLEFEEAAGAERDPPGDPAPTLCAGPGDLASLLAGDPILRALDEPQIAALDEMAERVSVDDGETVFREGQPSEDVYLVAAGTMVIQRETPFGTQELATVVPGHLFGEVNFIDGLSRSADAVARGSVSLWRMPHDGLRDLFQREARLAVVFLQAFWQGLSEKVREGNELMKGFFDEAEAPPGPEPAADAAEGEPADEESAPTPRKGGVDVDAKAGVLGERGLSGDDLRALAEYAEAEHHDIEQHIFREGDEGDALYVVLEGQVRISKHIPGVGEEALAILERGDFFGEMALVDRAPRSAAAVAHASDTTVLRIDKAHVDGLLQADPAAASAFLLELCRLLSVRLREINDKIVQWRYMSGGF